MFSNFFPPENRADYEIMWKNIVQPSRPQMTIWRMRLLCWIPKATYTHSEYLIHIAFPLQQWLHETYIAPPPFLCETAAAGWLCNTETVFSLYSRKAMYKCYLGGL